MISYVRVAEENKNKNEKESTSSNANRAPYINNVESLNERRNEKTLSKARSKVLKAAAKINW